MDDISADSVRSELARLRHAVQASGEVIFMTDREGVFTFVNSQFERLYGYTASEVVGSATPRLLKDAAAPPEHYVALWQRLLRGETIESEFRNRGKSGAPLQVQATVSPIHDERNVIVGFLAVQRDVSERKRADAALLASEERYRALVERSPNAVAVHRGGKVLYVNPTAVKLFGARSATDLVGKPLLELVHPDCHQVVLARLKQYADIGDSVPMIEEKFVKLDGTVIDVEVQGTAILYDGEPAFQVSVRDVTDRKQAREALDEAQRRLELIVRASNIGLWDWNPLDNTVYFSPEWKGQIGFADDELPNRFEEWQKRVHPDDLPGALARIRDYLQQSKGEDENEFRIQHKNGSYRWILARSSVLRDAQGDPYRVLGAHLDITKRKELEDQLRQSQKLEAVGSLAGGIAHDFNNLLTAILGYAELALGQLDPDSPVAEDVDEILRAGQSAESLTRQLLIFSRKGIVQPVLLRINDVVARLDKILRRVVGEDVEFIVRLGSDLGSVKADAGQLEQVVMNLVVNARDAMPTGGTLTIETDYVDGDQALGPSQEGAASGTFDRVAVTDTGSGMTPEVQAQIFNPFFTTKGPERGTGLGLATVYGIVQQAGGRITVKSAPGQGSTFEIYLPRVTEQPDTVGAGAGSLVPTGVETILFVEDDERVRALAVRTLRRYGYTVLPARHAAEAEAIAAEHRGIDLLVTDLVMPGINGRLLADRLRQSHNDLSVLCVSGYTSDSVALSEIRSSGMNFLPKPYTPETLARAVRNVLDRS